ncbi:hypothetical protein IGI04_023764, partial [Brassica rapa subsp. trilocularis]
IIHENAITFFFFENTYFTLSPSSYSSIHNILIAINTPTTLNNQFEALNAPKIDLHSFFSILMNQKQHLFTFFPYSSKKTQDFDSKIFMVHSAIEAYDSRYVHPDDFRVNRLAVDDLHGSLLVNAETTYTEVVHQTTSTKVTSLDSILYGRRPRHKTSRKSSGRLLGNLLVHYILEDFREDFP